MPNNEKERKVLHTCSPIYKYRKRFGSIPFRLLVGLEHIYYIPPGGAVQAMFRHARDLSMKPIIVVAMRDQFGMLPADVAVFERDGSGDGAKPLDGWDHLDPAQRVFYHQHRDLSVMLNGAALEGMAARFVANYTARLRGTGLVPGEGWAELPDLCAFLRDDMFHAACTGLLGERFFELCPGFARDFWDFDSRVLTYLRRTPRWMAPQAYAVRDRLLDSVKTWYKHARAQLDYRDPSLADVEYEPVWGARLMRARAEMFENAGFSLDGCASQDLGFVWAANANAIPVTMWVLLNVLLSQNLTERVMAETAECFDKTKGSFDVSALCNKPLLNSVYLEALRYCVATSSARHPVADDFTLCGWKIPRDALMLSIAWFGGRDAKVWNTGHILPNGTAEYPVDTFWAERFLEYPDDPASGPVRKTDEAIYRSTPKRSMGDDAQRDRTAKAIGHSPTLQGYFYPYGGGSRICPGRHLAKQEILVAVAIMLHEFEIELMDPVSAKNARPDPKMFPTGAIAPDRKLPVRIRRRRRREVEG